MLLVATNEDILILRERVRRLLCRETIAQWRIPQVLQNTASDKKVFKDVVYFINNQIVCGD